IENNVEDKYYNINYNFNYLSDNPILLLKNKGEWKVKLDGITTCIDHNYWKGVDNHGQRTMIYHNNKIRRLTPLECLRFMGFDDEDNKKLKTNNISDTQIYKMAGNSIIVDVVEQLIQQILIPIGVK